MDAALLPSLVALSPGTLVGTRAGRRAVDAFVRGARASAEAGLAGLVLREPRLEDGAFLELARRVREVFPGWFAVHDRVHLAVAAAADGVHLGGASLPAAAARQVLGSRSGLALGVSTHRGDPCPAADGVDYALHAPFRAPRSKPPGDGPPLGPEGVAEAAGVFAVPLLVAGGVDVDCMGALAHAGARGAAVIGALWGTGPEPLEGPGASALEDLDGLRQRTGALVEAAGQAFGEGDR